MLFRSSPYIWKNGISNTFRRGPIHQVPNCCCTRNRSECAAPSFSRMISSKLFTLLQRIHPCFPHLYLIPLAFVALYPAIRVQFGHGFESCDANGPRNVRNTNPAKQRQLLPIGSQESVLKVPKRGRFHVAIRVTTKRCGSCAQGALGRWTSWTVSRRNFCDAESLAKRYGETCH